MNSLRRGDESIFLARHAPPQLVAVVSVGVSRVIVIGIDVKMLRTMAG